MRKEPFFVGDFVHVFNRGNRKQEIVRDDKDRQNFLLVLYYLNNEISPPQPIARAKEFLRSKNSRSNLDELDESRFDLDFDDLDFDFRWPDNWGERKPLVKVLAFVLLDNHFHLILEEIVEGGIAKFMRKLGNSMTGHFNEKYKENGKLFQGSYKARRVDKDTYLQYLAVYIHIKNVFELYPGGFENALKNFDDAFEFALKYPYGSLGGYLDKGHLSSDIITKDIMESFIANKDDFKGFAKNCIGTISFNNKKMEVNA